MSTRLTSILTEFKYNLKSEPVTNSRCGDCKICVIECPAKAATGAEWNINLKRNDFFDAYKCCDIASERSNKIGIDATICGKCIALCPWTQKYIKRNIGKRNG